MRRLLLAVTFALVVSLFLAPSVAAQEEEMMEPPQEEAKEPLSEEIQEEMMEPDPERPFAQEKKMEKKGKEKPMPKTGGVEFGSVALAAGALLVSTGVLAYIVARRR